MLKLEGNKQRVCVCDMIDNTKNYPEPELLTKTKHTQIIDKHTGKIAMYSSHVHVRVLLHILMYVINLYYFYF